MSQHQKRKMTKIRIAVQKSGRLNQESLSLLKSCGVAIENGKDQLKASARNFPLEVFYLRNGDIPQYLRDGVVDIAILGENTLIEKGTDLPIVERLGFSKCKVSLAIPKGDDYNGVEDFEGKKIATSYPNTVTNYLAEKGISADLHIINGSVEIAPNIGLADAICDIVSSGSTLFKNNLKEVEVMLTSEAVLTVSPKISSEAQEILNKLQFRIQSVLRGQRSKYVLLNAPNDKLDKIISLLPVMDKNTFWDVIDELKLAGAEGILVCPIEKMVL